MEGLKGRFHVTLSNRAIGELMLAKAALEKNSKEINTKDAVIRELGMQSRILRTQLQETKKELDKLYKFIENEKREAYRSGAESVIDDAVQIIEQYENSRSKDKDEGGETLAARILECLESKYGAEGANEPAASDDPRLHKIINVLQGKKGAGKAARASKRFRMGMKLIMDEKLRVIDGGQQNDDKRKDRATSPPELVLVEGGDQNNRGTEPEGAA